MIKYYKISLASFVNTLEYRLDFLFALMSKFLPVVIQFFMWTAIYQNSPDEIILNYTYKQMILYTVISVFVGNLISVNIHWSIAEDIKNGVLSKYIILPINYFGYKVFHFLGAKFSDSIIISIGLFISMLIFQRSDYIDISCSNVFIFIFIALLALMLQYLICYCVAGIAFWLGECGGIYTIINVITLVITGGIFPLDIFGKTVIKISKMYPFYYITYFPTRILIGKESPAEIMNGIIVMLIWLVVLFGLMNLIWNKGMKKYIAAGG